MGIEHVSTTKKEVNPLEILVVGSAVLGLAMGGVALSQASQAEAQDESTHDLTVGESSRSRTPSEFGKPSVLRLGFWPDKQEVLTGRVRVIWGDRANGQALSVIAIDSRDPDGSVSTKQLDTYQQPELKNQLVATEGKTIQVQMDGVRPSSLLNVQRFPVGPVLNLPAFVKVGNLDCATADAQIKSPVIDYTAEQEKYLDEQLQNPNRATMGRNLNGVTLSRSKNEYLVNGGYPDLAKLAQECINALGSQNLSDINIFSIRVPEGMTYTAWGGRMVLKISGISREVGFTILPDLGWPEKDLMFHELMHALGARHTGGPLGVYNSQNSSVGDPNAGCDKTRVRQMVCGQNVNAADRIDFGVAQIIGTVESNEVETFDLNGRQIASVKLSDGSVLLFEYRDQSGYDRALNDFGVVATLMDRVRNKDNFVISPSGDGLSPDIFFKPGETMRLGEIEMCVMPGNGRKVVIGNGVSVGNCGRNRRTFLPFVVNK